MLRGFAHGGLAATFLWRVANGLNGEFVQLPLYILDGKQNRSANATEGNHAGGLPRAQGSPGNADNRANFVGPEKQPTLQTLFCVKSHLVTIIIERYRAKLRFC